MRRAFIAGIALGIALLLVPVSSPACGCGPNPRFVVAHGTSPNGAPWRIKADEGRGTANSRRSAEFAFISGNPDEYNESGYFSGLYLPIPPALIFHAVSGDGVYPELEGDVSGFSRPRAIHLVARMSDGSSLEIETQRPPTRLRRRFPWLRGLAFFDQFYPAKIKPVAIAAYGRDGRLLSRQKL